MLNDTEARAIHLAFALFLAYTAYPALRRSPRDHIPLQDWVMALLGAFASLYLYLFYDALSSRPGSPTTFDLVIAVIGMVLLLEATRRSLGPPLMVVALVFLAYVFLGQYAPDVLAYRGASLSKAMSHMWLTTEGVFGIALGVSTSFVFLFVLFSSLLDKAGAGAYFTQLAFALLGHMRGGPAKASVVSSALNGVVSGSSIANVVTGGVFTISLMKRVGYTPVQAGAIETSSSVNGQLMPPVMGAAAFLMVEYVGIPYSQIVMHAALPAVISYIALYYIVHLEALKLGLRPIPKSGPAQDLAGPAHGPAARLRRHRGGLRGGLLRRAPAQAAVRRLGASGASRCSFCSSMSGSSPTRRAFRTCRRRTRTSRSRRCPSPGPRSRSGCTSSCRWSCWSGA